MAQTQELNKPKQSNQTKQTLRPLGNRVLVRRLEQEEKLKGVFYCPTQLRKNRSKLR